MRGHFLRAEAVILDFDHAAEHLSDWAKALYPDAAESTRVTAEWCHRLPHEGGARWRAAGADAVCHFRALFRGERGSWDATAS